MKKLALAIASTLTATQAFSAISSGQIDQEIITLATLTPVTLSQSLSAVTVLNRADIERYQATDIFQLLARVPGVSFVRNGGRGSATSLFLRGNQSDHSLFLIDGVRIGSATLGSASLAALSTHLIERVDIIRGPKSNLYGADAIGGVVNIITRKTLAPKELIIETSYGTNSTAETTLVGGLRGDNYSFTAVVNVLDTDGQDNTEATTGLLGDDDAHSNNAIALNYTHQLSDKFNIALSYNRNETESDYDAGCTDNSTFVSVDCDIYSDGLVDSLSGLFELDISDVWRTSLQLGITNDESEELAKNIDLSTTFNGGEFNTTKKEVTWVNNLNVGAGQIITAGLNYQLDEVDSSVNYDEDSRNNKAAFFQLQSDFGVIDTNIGVRSDDNEQFGSHTTVSVLAGMDVNDNYRLVASYGEGFKAPTFNDLYYPFFGNASFDPEESKNYEIGLKANFDDTAITVAAFKNEVSNLIQYNPAVYASDQVAEAEISGIEFSVDTTVAGWMLGLSGSVIDPENKANGKLLRRRAEQSISADADYDVGDFSIGFSARAESERFDDVANNSKLGGYTLFGIRAAYALNDQWAIKAKVDNLTDKSYATAFDFSAGKYLGAGREVYVSVVFTPSL